MATDRCLFVARLEGAGIAQSVRQRAHALGRFYARFFDTGTGPDCELVQPQSTLAGTGVLAGVLPIDADLAVGEVGNLWTWGEEAMPLGAAEVDRVLGADDAWLRSFHGAGATVALGREHVRIVSGSAGPTAMYRSDGPGVSVWSTHAVAAAWLSSGRVELDFDRLPELVAFDFVGRFGTLIRGVSALPPAMCVDLDAGGVTQRCFWPQPERWALLDPRDAQQAGERALIETLGQRASGPAAPALGLTNGLDSQVVALALREAGIEFEAFTWGDEQWPDTLGAGRLAAELGIRHHVLAGDWLSDEGAVGELRRRAVFGDGVAPVSIVRRTWPASASVYVIGMGGETGRAFYYAQSRARLAAPSEPELLDALMIDSRINGASTEAIASARAAARGWLDDARGSGRDGWSLLDVAYAEQRVAHWGRSQYPPLARAIVPAFTPVEVARAMSALPLNDRLRSEFHRTFLRTRGHPNELARTPLSRRAAARAKRLLLPRLRPLGTSPDAVDELLLEAWSQRPTLRAWVADDLLRRPELLTAMGAAWVDAVRAGFLEGRAHAVEKAQLVAGPCALQDELGSLGSR